MMALPDSEHVNKQGHLAPRGWYILTALQWLLMAAIITMAYWYGLNWWSLLALPGIALHIWSVITLRVGLSGYVGGGLVSSGPFRYWRHPMYLGELIATCGLLAPVSSPWPWLGVAGLIAVFYLKIQQEERLLLNSVPDYAFYRQHTALIIPSLC